jgi:RND family efflux transporter MFP subunit
MHPLETSTAAARPPATAHLRGELASLKIDRSRKASASRLTGVLWLVLAIAIMGVLAAAGAWAFRDQLFPLPTVQVETVRIMTLGQASTQLTATGYLESRWQAQVGAKVPGRIANIPVSEGDEVKAGDLLAELEHADLDANLATRRAAVEQAEAQLAEAEFNEQQAHRELEREQDIFEQGAGTTEEVERTETRLRAARAIRLARAAAVSSANSAVLEAEEAVRNMYIYAPFDGTVVTKDAEKGESIMPGGMGASSGRGSVITLAKLDELEVDTDVKESYLGQLHKGQPAEVVVDAAPDRRYRGRLREIIPMGDRTRGIVKVKVTVLDPDERLFPELSATVHFLPEPQPGEQAAASQEKAAFAPAAAVQSGADGQFVWVLEGDRVRTTSVTVEGEPRDGLVRVTAGLVGGEQVVVDPSPELQAGAQVQAAE